MTTSERSIGAGGLPRAFLIIVLTWTILCFVGAFSSYTDRLQRGDLLPYSVLLSRWLSSHLAMIFISCAIHTYFARHSGALSNRRVLAGVYLLLVLVFLPFQIAFTAMLDLIKLEREVSLVSVARHVLPFGRTVWFIELVWVTFTYVSIAGLHMWRAGAEREAAWAQARHDNLSLQFQLEQQQAQALRGQLEPHFLFNALNAVSALVRADDKQVALDAIVNLSELLRYALQAGERERVTLADECEFVENYLALQKLRYGARLRILVSGADDSVMAAEVPPLLLQPLIENALRHDLDCHEGASDIHLAFRMANGGLAIAVSNPASSQRSPNPGLGLGLRHTRARLQLAYGGRAALVSGVRDGRFHVDIAIELAA